MVQTFLAIGAITLMAFVNMSLRSGFDSSGSVMQNAKIGIVATSIASSIVEEASAKNFDERTGDSLITVASNLTSPARLGSDATDSIGTMNDIDDFNNFVRHDTINMGDILKFVTFKTTCKVQYVDPATPDFSQSVQTWHKRISISVMSPAMTDTVQISYVYSYWYF